MAAQPKPQREQIERVLRELESREVRVGFFENAVYDDPDRTPVAYVAAIQELGYPEGGIPARPFLRPTFEAQRGALKSNLARGIRAALLGRISVPPMLAQIGQNMAGEVVKTIEQITEPPLAESTIASRRSKRKSPGVSTKPLVDSAYLIQSVESAVVDV